MVGEDGLFESTFVEEVSAVLSGFEALTPPADQRVC